MPEMIKNIRKDKIEEFNQYFSSFEVLDLDHKEKTNELNSH